MGLLCAQDTLESRVAGVLGAEGRVLRDEIGKVTCLSFLVRWESLRVLSRGVMSSDPSFKGSLWLL